MWCNKVHYIIADLPINVRVSRVMKNCIRFFEPNVVE